MVTLPEEREEIRRKALLQSSAMLMAAVNEPWEPADLLAEKGEGYVEEVVLEICRIAGRLRRQAG